MSTPEAMLAKPPTMMAINSLPVADSRKGLTSSGASVWPTKMFAAADSVSAPLVRIDLLITDVGLPGGLNGRQMADAAREKRPGLKVLFITGYAENAVVGHGHLAPGMQVVTKPFAMDALAARIRAMITEG